MAPHEIINNSYTERRVVITGMGVIAANGKDLPTFWESIRLGKSAGGPLTRFDPGDMPNRAAAEVTDFDGRNFMDRKRAQRLDLSTQFGIAAASLAVKDAGLDFKNMDPDRVGVVEGISLGGTETSLKGQVSLMNKSYRSINAFSLINGYTGSGSGEIALELGIKGQAITYCSSSASSNDALGYALNQIQQDDLDIMVAGGNEAPLLPALWAVFCLTKVMTCRNDAPKQSMRPFDKNRDGFLLGEGAGYLVLEELSHALTRGAKIYAEVLGHGRSCEAYQSVAPHPDGIGMYRAMEKALRRAKLHPSQVDYINAHGTATGLNDVVETTAIKRLFRDHAHRLAVSSTKPITGHLMGASGAIETVVSALAIKHQEIPPTINLTEPDVGCDLDYVRDKSRPYPVRVVMNLNSGFGGKNSCLILREYK
jgi:3-oxoacyl-[acyl-carrier-protein] synthase II